MSVAFRRVANPAVFPTFVAQHSVVFGLGSKCALDGVALPPTIEQAVPKRRLEFAAGRQCAHEALRVLAPLDGHSPIGIALDRSPVWPPGFVGSIAHTQGFASAAVAR